MTNMQLFTGWLLSAWGQPKFVLVCCFRLASGKWQRGAGHRASSRCPATGAINDRLQLNGAFSACRAGRPVRKGEAAFWAGSAICITDHTHSPLSAESWNLDSWLRSVYIKAVRMKPWAARGIKSRITSGGKKNNGACLFFLRQDQLLINTKYGVYWGLVV